MLPIEPLELKELLNKCWMTHDGMWFRHCLQECGMETTNKINKAAIYDAARIEAVRLARALEVERIETFAELYEFIQQANAIVKADFMKIACTSPEPNILRWDVQQCFAYEGITRLGVIAQYQCGIFERVKGWLDALGIEYAVTPEVHGCLMYDAGYCFRAFHFQFAPPAAGSAS